MAVSVGTALLGGALISAAGGVASSMAGGYDSPNAPLPTNVYYYDDDGNLTQSQEWDAEKRGYVVKTHLTEDQKKDKSQVENLRSKLFTYLDSTPEDRIKAYEEYAKTYSDALHKDVDTRYEQNKTATAEDMAGKGMLGSRAYVDFMAELNRQKGDADVDIANQANLAKESLEQADREYWLSGLNALNNYKNNASVLELQKNAGMSGIASNANALAASMYGVNSNNYLRDYEARMGNRANLSNNLTNTASGLAFLYGYNKGGRGSSAGTFGWGMQ